MNREFIDTYLQETNEIVQNLDREEINKFIDILFDIWKSGKKVITMGNGGSASNASHFAADLTKTVANTSSDREIVDSKRGFKAICLNDNPAVLTAWINDSGWDKAYSGLLNTFLDEGDAILIISVHGGSGWSGNIIEAMTLAKKRNAKILGLAGFDGGKLKELADSCIVVPKDSTPHTEGFHGVMQHLVVWRLKELIEQELKNPLVLNPKQLKEKFSDPVIRERINDIIKQYDLSKTKIKFFADTANLNEIEYCFSKGVDDGITTNPKIIELTGDSSLNFEEAGATYVRLFANRMLDAHILELSGSSLERINKFPNWKDIIKQNKDRYFEEAWKITLNKIAYVAEKLNGTNSQLIVG